MWVVTWYVNNTDHCCHLFHFPVLLSKKRITWLLNFIQFGSNTSCSPQNSEETDLLSVRGHNTGPLLPEHLRDPSPRILCHCETPYVPPHRRWPHIPSPSPRPPQNSDYQLNSEELRLVSEVQTRDLTLEVNSELLPTCSIVWLSWLLYIPLFSPSIFDNCI